MILSSKISSIKFSDIWACAHCQSLAKKNADWLLMSVNCSKTGVNMFYCYCSALTVSSKQVGPIHLQHTIYQLSHHRKKFCLQQFYIYTFKHNKNTCFSCIDTNSDWMITGEARLEEMGDNICLWQPIVQRHKWLSSHQDTIKNVGNNLFLS